MLSANWGCSLNIFIPEITKTRLAKSSWSIPNKLLPDQEIEKRPKMNEDELIALFNQVWEKYLQLAIEKAQTCDFNFVKTKLSQQSLNFVDNSQEHRTFRLKELNLEFIVQLKQLSSDQYELTQLWFLKSTDKYPNCILVCFDTVDEKKEFDNIAEQLNWKPQTLAKQLLLDFLNKFKR